MPQVYKSGDIVPESGVYRFVHDPEHAPPAEMSAVSAKYSCASAVRTVIGSLSGKRTELLVSAGPRPATGVLTSFTLHLCLRGYTATAATPRLLWYSQRTKGHAP